MQVVYNGRPSADGMYVARGEVNAARNGPLPKALNRSSSPYRVLCPLTLTRTSRALKMRMAQMTRKLRASMLLRYSFFHGVCAKVLNLILDRSDMRLYAYLSFNDSKTTLEFILMEQLMNFQLWSFGANPVQNMM